MLSMKMVNTLPKELRIKTAYGHLAVKVWHESGKKTPIFAIHGRTDNAGTWDNLCPLLDEGYPIFALDFPGHGFSSYPPIGKGTYYTDLMVTMDKVIHHFNWKKVILLGHSLGGVMSILYAGARPHLVEKLIVMDVFPQTVVEEDDQPRQTADSLGELLKAEQNVKKDSPRYSYEELVQKLIRARNELTEDAAKTLLVRNSIKHDDGKYSFRNSPILKVSNTLSMTFKQQKSFVSNVTCELLLIISATSNSLGQREEAREILNSYQQTCKYLDFEVIDGNHYVHLINPGQVAELMNRFLPGLSQSEASKVRRNHFIASRL